MEILQKMRSDGFWVVDFLKGGHVQRHYNEIKDQYENYELDRVSVASQKKLEKILHHAIQTTPFYCNFKKYQSISDFPIINKSIIKDNISLFYSNIFNIHDLHKVTTSGSTGAPFSIWQDKEKRWRHAADNIYLSELAGSRLGTRIYYIRVWNKINRKRFITKKLQNIEMVDGANLSDQRIEKFLKVLTNDKSSKTILSFASSLEIIGRFAAQNRFQKHLNINCIISISENLPKKAKNELMKAFNCPVIPRYSNIENGLLAQQCFDNSGEYHINYPSFYIELLRADRDEPAKNGELGRIVVTDLFNFGMPIIRYDTGDMAVMSNKSICGRPGLVFREVEGRKVDFIYDTKGNLLSPHTITNTMWKYSEYIKQFQFIQETKDDFIIKINPISNSFSKEMGKEMVSDLKSFVGQDAKIQIMYEEEIPVLASGKRRKIVNNYKLEREI